MVLSKTMEEAIKEKDLGKIYSSFYTILLADPAFNTGKFDEVFEIVRKQNISGFIQQYNNVPFKTEDEWDQQYWDTLSSELMDNFCIERINHLKLVSRKLYPSAQKKAQASAQKKTEQRQEAAYQKKANTGILIVITAAIAILLIIILVLLL